MKAFSFIVSCFLLMSDNRRWIAQKNDHPTFPKMFNISSNIKKACRIKYWIRLSWP